MPLYLYNQWVPTHNEHLLVMNSIWKYTIAYNVCVWMYECDNLWILRIKLQILQI